MFYALRDAFGYKDVWQDTLTTVSGTEFNYRTFEPADGVAASWQKRINRGLRYTQGGRNKYWIINEYDSSISGQHYAGESSRQGAVFMALPPQNWGDPEASGMLGFQEATWDVEAERDYAEAREMIYGDVNYPVLPVSRRRRQLSSMESGIGGYGIGANSSHHRSASYSTPTRSKRKYKGKAPSTNNTHSSDPTTPLFIDAAYVRNSP
jgi:hypothetical protein